MGTVKREFPDKYSTFDFDINLVSAIPNEVHKYFPIAKSCSLAMKFMRLACREIINSVTKETEIDCELITRKIYELMHESLESGFNWEFPDNLPGEIKFFYYPKVQGADNYNFHRKQIDSSEPFEFDIIQLAVGINYKNYYSNYIRTLLINPTDKILENFYFLTSVERVILYYLRDGIALSKVYESAMSFAEMKDQDLAKHLKKEFGFALNPIFEDDLIINPNTKAIVKYGMTFSMNINLTSLEEAGRVYDLCCSDTVLVRKNAPAEVLTRVQRNEFAAIIKVERCPAKEDPMSSSYLRNYLNNFTISLLEKSRK